MPILQQHAVDEELHLLSFQPGERSSDQRLIVIGLGNPFVVQEAPQPLFLGILGRIERHRAGNLAELGRDTLRDTDYHHGERIELTGAHARQPGCQGRARAIIQPRGEHGCLQWLIKAWHA